MKPIIIATDFSKVAKSAAEYGANMAKETGADIILFHTYNIPVSATEIPLQSVNIVELKQQVEEDLEELAVHLKSIIGNTININKVAVLGYMPEELEIFCKSTSPLLIIMGSKGLTDLEHILFGSTTLSTIRHITWPVIAVHEMQTYKSIHKIGLACDFSVAVETTPANKIKEIVKIFNAELHVLKIETKHNEFTAMTPHETILLHAMLEDIKPAYHYIKNPDVEAGVHQFATENNLDMVIVIPKKHGLLGNIFHKSTTKKFIDRSDIPVMCMHDE